MQSSLFLIKFYIFPQTRLTVSSAEILQMFRSIEIPLRFIRLDVHKLGIFGIFLELFVYCRRSYEYFLKKEQLKNN